MLLYLIVSFAFISGLFPKEKSWNLREKGASAALAYALVGFFYWGDGIILAMLPTSLWLTARMLRIAKILIIPGESTWTIQDAVDISPLLTEKRELRLQQSKHPLSILS